MIDIPALRRSENDVSSDLSKYHGMPCDDLTACQEWGFPPGTGLGFSGRWVPRDVHGLLVGEQSYFSSALMRSEYPGIKLVDENGEELLELSELCDD